MSTGSGSAGHKAVGIGNWHLDRIARVRGRRHWPVSLRHEGGARTLSVRVVGVTGTNLICKFCIASLVRTRRRGVSACEQARMRRRHFLDLRWHNDAIQLIGLAIELERGTDMKAKVRRCLL